MMLIGKKAVNKIEENKKNKLGIPGWLSVGFFAVAAVVILYSSIVTIPKREELRKNKSLKYSTQIEEKYGTLGYTSTIEGSHRLLEDIGYEGRFPRKPISSIREGDVPQHDDEGIILNCGSEYCDLITSYSKIEELALRK